MKSPSSPDRIVGSIEPLEARIAPATLFIGDHNFTNVLDVEYIEKNKQAGQTLFFVNTSAASADPAQPEGDPGLKASDAFSQILDGAGVGTYYLKLKQGDVVFRFTDNGYKELVRVTGGNALAYFTDYNHNIDYDDGEFTGLSLGQNASVLVSEKLFGDAVTNLNGGRLTAANAAPGADYTRDDTLDPNGLVNFRQNITYLAIQGGSLFGKVLAGGNINSLNIGGNVDGVYAGAAAIGKTYDFFPGVPGGEGTITTAPATLYPKNVIGASVFNTKVLSVTDGIYAGDGGASAKGGEIRGIQVTQDTDGLIIQAGKGGSADLTKRAITGGTGGSVQNVYIAGLLDQTPNSVLLTQKVQILAGDGGDALVNTAGGNGGITRGVFVGFELSGTRVISSGDVLRDTVLIKAGAGGDGLTGGLGGSLVSTRVRVQTPDSLGDEIALIAGTGGNSLGTTGGAGAGGSVLNLDARNQEFSFNSDLLVQAGDAGTTVGQGFGANGGALTNVTLQGFDLQILAGNGSDGRAGGGGGSISNLILTRDENQVVLPHNVAIEAGSGGDATRLNGGAGGVINSLKVDKSDVTSFLVNTGVHANGGTGGIFGIGGAGGYVRDVIMVDSDSGVGFEGLIKIRSGDGGNGARGGGLGGTIARTSVAAINANVQAKAGDGGNATSFGQGGDGGTLNTVEFSSEGVVARQYVSGAATAGSGGAGAGQGMRGGAGGGAAFVNIDVVANTLATDVAGGGDAFLTAGKGGNGQANFVNTRGVSLSGGAPGRGGSIQVSGLFAEVGGASMIAGDAGDVGNRPAAGGSIFGEANNAKLVGLRALTELLAQGGHGTHGGSGGSISNLAYGSTANSLSPTPRGNILIQAGDGSAEGTNGGLGGSLGFIDGSVSSDPGSTTHIFAGDGGGASAKLPVTELIKGTAAVNEVQVINLSSLAGVASSTFTLAFGTNTSVSLVGTKINVASVQAELARLFPVNTPTASLDPANASLLKISYATTGEQAPIVAASQNNARFAGAGGSVSQLSIFLGGGSNVELKVEAGDGGDVPLGRSGGAGGRIAVVGVAGLDAATIVRSFGAGDGGDGRVVGGVGGSVASVAVQDHDIGVRSGLAFGYNAMGGIFAGAGGDAVLPRANGGQDGSAGSVRDINANSIASIVAGKTLTPQFAESVSEIFLNGDVQLVTRDGALISNSPLRLTFEGNQTASISGNATNSQIQDALNRLPAIQNSGVGGSLQILEKARGDATRLEVQTVFLGDIAGVAGANFRLTFGNNSASFAATATATQIAAGLNALPSVQAAGGVTVVTNPDGFDIGFNQFGNQSSFIGAGQTLWSLETTPGTATQAEVQTIFLGGIAGHANATFKLSFGADSTTLAATATVAEVQTALNGLASITAAGGVTVTDTLNGSFQVKFNTVGNREAIVGNGFENLPVTETTQGTAVTAEVQTISLGNIAAHTNATFQLTFGTDSIVLPATASASAVATALNSLPSVQTAGGVTVAGSASGPYTVTFSSAGNRAPIAGLGFELGTVSVSYSTGSYVVNFESTGNQVLISGEEAVPVDVTTVVDGRITLQDTKEVVSGLVNLTSSTTLEGQQNLSVAEIVSGGTLFLSSELIRGDALDLPPIAEVQRLDLSTLLSFPTGRVNLTFTDAGSATTGTTGPLGPTLTALGVQQALNALPSVIAVGQVSVLLVTPGVFDVTFLRVGDQAPISGKFILPETQRVFLGNLATTAGAQFALTYDPGDAASSTTPLLAANSTALQVDAAIEALPAIQALTGTVNDKVTVTSTQPGVYSILFNSIDQKNEFTGLGFLPEIQQVDLGTLPASPTASFRLSYDSIQTAAIPVTADAAAIDAALEALSSIQALAGTAGDKVGVTKVANSSLINVTFKSNGDKEQLAVTGARAEVQQLDINELIATPGSDFTLTVSHNVPVSEKNNGNDGGSVAAFVSTQRPGEFNLPNTEVTRGTTTGAEVQRINLGAVAGQANGTFTLTFGTSTTAALPSTATAANIETALNALTAVTDAGGLTVVAGTAGQFTVTFTTPGDQALITGIGDVSEIQVIELDKLRTTPGGQFVLTYGGDDTAPLARDATPAQVDAALELLPGIAALPGGTAGNKVTVVAGTGGFEYQVTFNGIGNPDPLAITAAGTADFEIQSLDLSSLATFGANSRVNLSFNGDAPVTVPGNATAMMIDAALETLPSIRALGPPGPNPDNVTVTSPSAGVFEIAFKTFGDQPLIQGTSQVGPSATQIGTTIRLNPDATAAQVQAAITTVSQAVVTVTAGAAAGTFNIAFAENGDQPAIFATEFFHERESIDLYAEGLFTLQFGTDTTVRLDATATPLAVDAALEALPSIVALPGPVGDKVDVTVGPNSSYLISFHGDGAILPLVGAQFESLTVGNQVNGFPRDGTVGTREQQLLSYFNKREFTADFFDTTVPDPFNPRAHPAGNLVGAISDINEVDANVFHYIHNGVVTAADSTHLFQLGDQPIDGLIMTKTLDQNTINFTPEARLVYDARSRSALFFDNDNII